MTASGTTLRVLTWNVHGCVGRDGVCDPARVARVLEAAQPDICALQEIDARTRAQALDPFSYFGELFGWTTVSARTLTARDGQYGHIVMSRWPIESLGEVDLSVRFLEPRKAILGAVSAPRSRIGIVAAHFGLWPIERRRQFGRLKRALAEIGGGPMIALGDFNDFPRQRPRGAQPLPTVRADAFACYLSVAVAAAAARSHLVQQAARVRHDRNDPRRGARVGSSAAARELAPAVDPIVRAHVRADTSVEGFRPFTTALSHASADA